MRISDWSSDVCSSDLRAALPGTINPAVAGAVLVPLFECIDDAWRCGAIPRAGRPDASGVIPGFGKGTDRGIAEAFETKVHSVNRPQRSPPECPHHQVRPFVTEHTPATFLDADQEARLAKMRLERQLIAANIGLNHW